MSSDMTMAHRPSLKTLPSVTHVRGSSRPAIADLKLSQVLNQETCPPISFDEFVQFTTNKEFTSENLLFVLWYRSYAHQWSLIPEEQRRKVPIPSTTLGDRYSPFAYLDNRSTTAVDLSSPNTLCAPSCIKCSRSDSDCSCKGGMGAKNRKWSFFERRSNSIADDAFDIDMTCITVRPLLPPHDTEFTPAQEQPMREEALRAFATFLKSGGSKELGVSDDLRQYAKICLERSSAPEVFLPIYEDIYNVVERQSLPHFIEQSRGNVNGPKAKFWYMVGFVDFLIGLIIFLLVTLLVSDRRFAYRAIRLPSTIFVWFGIAQIYSAYREFCSQVWGRKAYQLRPWELDTEDEEETIGTAEDRPNLPELVASISASTDFVSQRTDSMTSNVVATPWSPISTTKPPDGFHPLTDFSGVTSNTSSDSLPWGKQVIQHEDEILDEAARRQLAIRRETIKVPDASMAFPINVEAGQSSNDASRSDLTVKTKLPSEQASLDVSPITTEKTPMSGKASVMNLGDLMLSLQRKTTGKTIGEGRTFGPEKHVEDPRVHSLYESIVRDITVVASIAAVIWVGLCFAVPMAGLV